jgi:uncharacterized protein (DUF1778 family)
VYILRMPKQSKPKGIKTRAEQFNVRIHAGDKAFLRLAAVSKNVSSLSGYIIQAALRQAERDLNEPHTILRRNEYEERAADFVRQHPGHPIFLK